MCTPSHPSLSSPSFSVSLDFSHIVFSPSSCLQCLSQQWKRVPSLSVCSRTRDRRRRKRRCKGGRWVRGYKTGLARVWRIVFVDHLRRQGFIEVKKVARHRLPAMKWAPSMLVSHHSLLLFFLFFLSYVSSSSHFRGYLCTEVFSSSWLRKTIRDAFYSELLSRVYCRIFHFICDPRNFELDVDVDKIFISPGSNGWCSTNMSFYTFFQM